ncbi:homoserine dehydrogenase-domain-containing protein [Ilyonectria destructans]|nr:homoserine dehydrogenase-domain-containing protein [Ilyonectria destructans]
MTSPKEVNIAVIGAGGVGSVFVKQLAWLSKNRPDLRLRLCYIAIIDKALYHADYSDIDVGTAIKTLEATGGPLPSIPETIEYLSKAPYKVVAVDNTSSQAIANAYPDFLRRGISIITPNKKAFSSGYQLWQEIFAATSPEGPFVYHESSVGAGMPIVSTLNELVDTGDEVTRIEGVFSGTLSYLFNSFAPVSGTSGKWSDEVLKAKQLGYTEPDPRDDLNGLDVARKITILGRLAGIPIDLIPKDLEGVSDTSEFLEKFVNFDHEMEEQKVAAEKAGKVVRFIGSIDIATRQAKVGLEWFDRSHPIANLEGTDNIISFYTKRYGKLPLTIRGAGAGGDVTAMGVTGDLLKVLSQM